MSSKVFILYENEDWLVPLKPAFQKVNLDIEPLFVNELSVDLDQEPPQGVFLNRLSASSFTRDHAQSLASGERLIGWLEHWGRRVINGSNAIRLERSKFHQYLSLTESKITCPQTVFVSGGRDALEEQGQKLNFPFVYKYDCGGKGLGVQLVRSQEEWLELLERNSWQESPGSQHLLQQYIEAKEPFITRCEFIGGKFHYAIQADTSQGFELCPAEACAIDRCQLDGESQSLFKLRTEVDSTLIASYEAMLAKLGIEVAGIEFIEDKNGQAFTYDINCNTNYSPDIDALDGVEPGLERLANFVKSLCEQGEQR